MPKSSKKTTAAPAPAPSPEPVEAAAPSVADMMKEFVWRPGLENVFKEAEAQQQAFGDLAQGAMKNAIAEMHAQSSSATTMAVAILAETAKAGMPAALVALAKGGDNGAAA